MAGDFSLEPQLLKEIIEYFIKIKLIVLDNDTIYCKKLIEKLQPLLAKRNRDNEYYANGTIPTNDIPLTESTNKDVSANESTQSKVKESKVKYINTAHGKKWYNDTFEIFWDIYDKKVDSKKCREKWFRLSQDDIMNIDKTLHIYKEAHPDRQFRKNPETYLNNQCWLDDYSPKEEKRGLVL